MTPTPGSIGRGEPELVYLRRQGNLRVRKARWIRNLLRPWKVILLNLAAAALVIVGGIRAATQLMSSDAFALATIDVDGTQRTSPRSVEARLHEYVGRNLMQLDLDEVAGRSQSDPWVRSASVRRVFPRSLHVSVVERTPAALAVVDGLVQLIDTTGTPIGAVGPGLVEDRPVLTGLAGLRGPVLATRLTLGVEALEQLRSSAPEFTEEISELDVSSLDAFVVTTRTPGPRIVLDPTAADRNVRAYLARRREIETRVGASETVDLRWHGRITALPDPEEKETE